MDAASQLGHAPGHGAASDGQTGRHRRRRALGAGVSLVVIGALLAVALSTINLHALGHALASVQLGWVLVALALMAAAFIARGEAWFVGVRAALPGAAVSRLAVTRALLIGMATSSVTPGRVGEVLRAWVLARRLGSTGDYLALVAGTLVVQTLLNVTALTILSVIAVAGGTGSHSVLAISAGSVLLPIGLVGLLLVAPAALARASRSGSVPLRRLVDWLAAQTARARIGLTVLRRPGRFAHAALAQLTAWGLQLGVCYTTLLAVNLHPHAPVAAAAAVLVAVNITAIIPVTPSNIAVFQAACIAVLAGFGVNAEQALAYGLILQGVEIAVALSMGGPSLIREGLAWHHARPRPDPAPASPVSAGS